MLDIGDFTSSGFVAGENISTAVLAYTDKNAGSNKIITISDAKADTNTNLANYKITYVNSSTSNITQASLILRASDQTKIYDGTTSVDNKSGFTSSGFVAGENISTAVLAFKDKNAGSNKIITISDAKGDDNTNLANYNITYVNSSTSNITRANLSLIASDQTKTYDGTTSVNNKSGFTSNGFVAGENISTAALAYKDKNAGSNKIISISDAKGDANTNLANYNITYVNSTKSNITRANLTLIASDQTKTYDGTTSVNNKSGFTSNGFIAGENISSVKLAFTDKNTGLKKSITISDAVEDTNTSLSNYNINYQFSSNSMIEKRNINNITGIEANNKSYDKTNMAVLNFSKAIVTGAVEGDHVYVSNGSGVFSDATVGNNKTVYISNISLGGFDSGNYNLVNTNFQTFASISTSDYTLKS